MPVNTSLDLAGPELVAFCRRSKVRELAVFGSTLREDFGPESDVDLLVTFDPSANLAFSSRRRLRASWPPFWDGRWTL